MEYVITHSRHCALCVSIAYGRLSSGPYNDQEPASNPDSGIFHLCYLQYLTSLSFHILRNKNKNRDNLEALKEFIFQQLWMLSKHDSLLLIKQRIKCYTNFLKLRFDKRYLHPNHLHVSGPGVKKKSGDTLSYKLSSVFLETPEEASCIYSENFLVSLKMSKQV